jgi:hypothetical protein
MYCAMVAPSRPEKGLLDENATCDPTGRIRNTKMHDQNVCCGVVFIRLSGERFSPLISRMHLQAK